MGRSTWVSMVIMMVLCIGLLVVASGCAMPELRVKAVHLVEPPAKNTADIVVRYSGREIAVSVEVEAVHDSRSP